MKANEIPGIQTKGEKRLLRTEEKIEINCTLEERTVKTDVHIYL
jgi:hypothetical protein